MFRHATISGKIIAAGLFGVVLLGGALWQRAAQTDTSVGDTLAPAVASSSADAMLDSDNDGLKDWEEELIGTDPNNPDTNNNGINDGDEVKAVRQEVAETLAHATTTPDDLTHTDQLTREIFGAYIQTKQLGTYEPTAFENIVQAVAQNQFGSLQPPYTMEDIAIDPDISTARTLEYEREFQEVIIAVTDIPEYELTTYGRAIETGNSEEFEKLKEASDVYADIADTLLSITAPEDAARAHLDLVNSFALLSHTLSVMATSPEDPMLAFVAMRDFLEREDAIKTAYSQIDIYFTLKETDAGV